MTPELDRALDAFEVRFADEIAAGRIKHIGITNCRRKNNKPNAPWSEHAWSNAADIHVSMGRPATGDAKKLGDEIAAWMRSRRDLWSEVFWQVAAHLDHVHGTANPRRNFDNKQVPPCAGGPPDPDPEPPPTLEDNMLPLDPTSAREDIRLLQDRLNIGFSAGLSLDGVWGSSTTAAVAQHLGSFTGDDDAAAGKRVVARQWNELLLAVVRRQGGGGGVTEARVKQIIAATKLTP